MRGGRQITTLVLGGGGLRGLAHIGAWKALCEAGIEVDEISGTSIGALVGACIAGGLGDVELAARARALTKNDIVVLNRWAILFNGIRQRSVFRGDVLRQYLERTLPVRRFQDLEIPLWVNSVDLQTGEEVWFGGRAEELDVCDAVYASCALPVFYPPARIGERWCVDGGVGNPLPVDAALARGADRVIAVDVGASLSAAAGDTVEKGMIAIHQRVMQIMGGVRAGERADARPEVLYVRAQLDRYETFDFDNTELFLEEGYRATRAALASWAEETAPRS